MKTKTDNGWFRISEDKPKSNENVIVIVERESSSGCLYAFNICESVYRDGYPTGRFSVENSAWKVRYWRRKEEFPYPDGIVKREVEECRKHNCSPSKIFEHQRKFGIEYDEESFARKI